MRETTSQIQYAARQNQKCWLQNKPKRHQKNLPSHGGKWFTSKRNVQKKRWGEDLLLPPLPSPQKTIWHWCLRCMQMCHLGMANRHSLDRNLPLVSCLPHPLQADLRKVVFKILEGEIREGEQPISALCTSTGLLCKMSVSSITLAADLVPA